MSESHLRPFIFGPEFVRLRRGFEQHASRYTDETLTFYLLEVGVEPPAHEVHRPNPTMTLFQYMGDVAAEEDRQRILSGSRTRFGLAGAEFSIFAIFKGSETALFHRMAVRAASAIPSAVRDIIFRNLCGYVAAAPGLEKPVFVCNADPLAIWLNLVLVCVSDFQMEHGRRSTLTVDPFAASILACDYLVSYFAPSTCGEPTVTSGASRTRFQVALSFPGERREFVAQVAEGLRARNVNVFYDGYFEADLARPDLDLALQRIYHDESDLVAVFLCREYEQKEWCGLEWRAVRDLIKKRKANAIMPFRFDDTEIPGLFSIDGYVDLRTRTPEDTVQLIQHRLCSPSASSLSAG